MIPGLPPSAPLARGSYPPPPWLLHGTALVTTYTLPAERVRALVPEPFALVTLPGANVLAYLGVARYIVGSTLEYSELLAGVVVRHGWQYRPFITHAAVDRPLVQRAGRELWLLPRQLWRFEWQFDPLITNVRVWDGARLVCAISDVPANARLMPLRTSQSFFTLRGSEAASFRVGLDVRSASTHWNLLIGRDGPLHHVEPGGRRLSLVAKGVSELHGLEPQEG